MINAASSGHPTEGQAPANTLFTGSGTGWLLTLPQHDNYYEGHHFLMYSRLNHDSVTWRIVLSSEKNNRINIFEARGSILRGINSDVSFTLINVKKIKIRHIL